jgi:hypothetical protein
MPARTDPVGAGQTDRLAWGEGWSASVRTTARYGTERHAPRVLALRSPRGVPTTDQKADAAKSPVGAVDPAASTTAEKTFENEGGGNQAPPAPTPAPPSRIGKVEQAARTLRVRFTRPGRPS